MKRNINGENMTQNNGKITTSLSDLMDNMVFENLNYSEIYEEYGGKKDELKKIYNIEENSSGRYTHKYIHYIMKNQDINQITSKKKKKNN